MENINEQSGLDIGDCKGKVNSAEVAETAESTETIVFS